MSVEDVRRYRVHPWRFFLVYKGASYRFSYRHVLAPAAHRDRPVFNTALGVVQKQLRRLQMLWATRVKSFVVNKLWLFGSGEINESIHFSVRRRIFCTPENVKLVNKKYRGRPCSEYHICPFCFARRARWLYKKAAKFLKEQSPGQRSRLYVACRVSRYFVSANGFSANNCWPESAKKAAIKRLRTRLEQEIKKYKDFSRMLRRTTEGSTWMTTINPVAGGWEIDVRQLSITNSHQCKAFVHNRKAKTTTLVRSKLNVDEAMSDAIAAFVVYPKGLLYEYEEMAAAALHARYGLRLFYSTGCLAGKRPNGDTHRKRRSDSQSNSILE